MEHWWGFRPCTPDFKPIIGKTQIVNLYIATGHYRNGVLFSAITSDIMFKLIQEKLSTILKLLSLKNLVLIDFKYKFL